MLKENMKLLTIGFKLIDVIIILFGFWVSYYIYVASAENLDWVVFFIQHKLFFLGYGAVWIYFSHFFELYSSKRLSLFVDEAWDVIKSITFTLVAVSLPTLLLGYFPQDLKFFSGIWLCQATGLIFFRLVLRKVLRHFRSRGYNYRQIVIVGRNMRAAKLAQEIERRVDSGIKILGFIDAPYEEKALQCSYDFKMLGSLEDLEGVLQEQVVDEVFITLPIKSFYSRIESIIQLCETVGVETKIPTDLFNPRLSKSTISQYFDVPFIDLYTSPKMNWQLFIKRLLDVMLSATLLAIFFPLGVIIAILIKTTSQGPIFFKQKRVGYNNRPFVLLKFRSMVSNAEALKEELLSCNEMSGPVFKMKNDPRITTIGRVIRKTSMDELPQLINVLRGDMSLVGPRPPVPSEVCQYDLKDRRRLSMKPGITGIWQVCGRNSIPFDRWMEMDRQYIDQWSLWLDLKLLAKTVPAVLKGTGSA